MVRIRFERLRAWCQGIDGSATSWRWWTCTTVLLLFATRMGEHEYQLFQHTVEVQSPVARDFAVYYVAGRVALGEGGGRLYYVPSEPTKAARAQPIVRRRSARHRLVKNRHSYNGIFYYLLCLPAIFCLDLLSLDSLQSQSRLFLMAGSKYRDVVSVHLPDSARFPTQGRFSCVPDCGSGRAFLLSFC